MGLLHVCVGVLLMMVMDTHASGSGCSDCGCIVHDPTYIPEENYVCEPTRSSDFQYFLERLYDRLGDHWNAFTFIYSFPDNSKPHAELGSPLCDTEQKKILGYWKNNGLTLCLVVYPHLQNVEKAECDGEGCCGRNTRCEPGGFVLRKYLVYCDAFYTGSDGCLIGNDILSETKPDGIDEDGFIPPTTQPLRKKREHEDASYGNSTTTPTISRVKRTGSCPDTDYYFAFRHDFLPSTCSCRICHK